MGSKRKLQIGAILAAMALLLGPAIAAADTPPAAAPAGSTLEQRVAQRKAERRVALGETDLQRQISTCVNAQGKLRLIQTNDAAMFSNRLSAYYAIDAKLWIVIGQIRLAHKDTFQLEKQHETYVGKIYS